MKFKSLTAAIVGLTVIGLLLIAGGCGPQTQPTGEKLSGRVTAAGSTALLPLAKEAAERFMQKYPGVNVNVSGGGSFTGLTQVASGAVDIGDSDVPATASRDIDPKELVDHKVCVVGFVTIVHPGLTVDNLTRQQVVDVFTGKITNWKEVGGPDQKIVLVLRPMASGTRAVFKKEALNGKEEASGIALTQDSSGAVKQAVAQTPGAISVDGLAYLDSSVKPLKFDGVEANAANITSGKYPIWSYEHMYTKGEPKGATKAFLDYILSEEVQRGIVPKLKYIPIVDMKVQRSE
ncbi:MAG: phosphate ABC transporter substrate-binding protein [Chloroflexi bacterium]|nr:phosphate ABC transporter substrate-binding protein [Chloroflexota bacterium]MCL5074387.1 phosphate ABC transporter substrate-binding protein [Chloroflexota bacterium]